MTRGLFIGRFQPFHKGHLAVIRKALRQVDELLILIGSAQEARTATNPFTATERKRMITAALKEAKITRCKIFQLSDIPDDNKYAGYVQKNLPPFEIVFVGDNKLVKRLFSKAGYAVVEYGRLNECIATEIRKRMRSGKKYAHLLPKAVYEMVKQAETKVF